MTITDLRMIGLDSLSAREETVLRHMQAGLTAVEIARTDYVTLATARSQIRSILMKLGVNSQLAAVAMANRRRPLACDTCTRACG